MCLLVNLNINKRLKTDMSHLYGPHSLSFQRKFEEGAHRQSQKYKTIGSVQNKSNKKPKNEKKEKQENARLESMRIYLFKSSSIVPTLETNLT